MKLKFRLVEAKRQKLPDELKNRKFTKLEILDILGSKNFDHFCLFQYPDSDFQPRKRISNFLNDLMSNCNPSISYLEILLTTPLGKKCGKALKYIISELTNYLLLNYSSDLDKETNTSNSEPTLKTTTTKNSELTTPVQTASSSISNNVDSSEKDDSSNTNIKLTAENALDKLLDKSNNGWFYEFVFYLLTKNKESNIPISNITTEDYTLIDESRGKLFNVDSVKELYLDNSSLSSSTISNKKNILKKIRSSGGITQEDIINFFKTKDITIDNDKIDNNIIKELNKLVFRIIPKLDLKLLIDIQKLSQPDLKLQYLLFLIFLKKDKINDKDLLTLVESLEHTKKPLLMADIKDRLMKFCSDKNILNNDEFKSAYDNLLRGE